MADNASTKNRNATPSAFGWEFQINAAIIIMLNNIHKALGVKVEGKTQDIEIFLNKGEKIFAQAKGCMKAEDNTNAIRDLNNAIETLVDSQHEHPQSLIFVTNRIDPFANISTIRNFAGAYSYHRYEELPDVCKKRIEDICNRNNYILDKDILSVLVFDFSGDGDNRYRIVKQHIAEFLVSLDEAYIGFTQKLMERWQLSFGQNATQNDRSRTISKNEMIWPLIVWLCKKGTNEKLQNYDEATSEIVSSNYEKIINETSEHFEFVSKVTTEYAKYEKLNSGLINKEITERFISEKSILFQDEFDLSNIDHAIAETIIKLTIEKVLRERYYISKIKTAVNIP